MSQLDALLARSKQPGQFVERKAFSLAREKAVEKMREFSLRHPEQYVLELIQAAVFAEATWIAVDVTDHSILLGYIGGKQLVRDELDQLFDYLFVDQTYRPTRHLMQLAVGLNALIQRKPSVVRVESGTGKQGETTRLDLDANGKGVVGVADAPLAGTYIYAEFKSGWLGRFLSTNSVGFENDLIERRCIYTPVPILLNGRAPFGYTGRRNISLFGMAKQVDLADKDEVGHRRGTIGVIKQSSLKAEFRMVVGGVLVSTLEIPELGRGLAGVLCDDTLRKTADMSDIVQDDSYIEMLHVLQPVASSLLKQAGKRYTPPTLPRRPKPKANTDAQAPRVDVVTITPEPLPKKVKQLGIRQPLTAADLPREDEEGFVFWVDKKDDLNDIEAAADPLVLPYRVLLLTPGQALTLDQHSGYKTPRRLTSSEDIAFVRRAVERNREIVNVPVPSDVLPDEVQSCHLRFHVRGEVPAWGVGRDGVPTYVRGPKQSRYLKRIPVSFPYVSMVMECSKEMDDEGERMLLAERVLLNEVWRLLPETPCARSTELAAALLAVHCHPYFVREDTRTGLEVGFPSRWWSEHVARILSMPLRIPEHDTLTLSSLIALQGTSDVIEMSGASENTLHRLQEQLGWGHIHTPELEDQWIAAWCLRGSQWVREVHTEVALAHEACIVLNTSLKRSESRHIADVPWDIPAVTFLSQEFPLSVDQWQAGLNRVLQDLAMAELVPVRGDQKRGWAIYERAFSTIQRSQAMGGLALLGIALALEAWDTPILRATGGAVVTLAEIKNHTVRVAPLHGAYVQEDDVVLLTYDELTLLENNDVVPELCIDDGPRVWRELKTNSENWLLQQTLRIAGMEGKIGFRFPYDATSGILVESSRTVNVLSEFLGSVPCHGLIELTGGLTQPSEMQGRMMALAANQLVQGLLDLLDNSSVAPQRRDVAQQYAAQYIRDLHRAQGGQLPTRVARQLADRVQVLDASGVYVPILSTLSLDGTTSAADDTGTATEGGSSIPPIDGGVVRSRLKAAMTRIEQQVNLSSGSIRVVAWDPRSPRAFQSESGAARDNNEMKTTLCRLVWGTTIEFNATHRIAKAAEHNVFAMNLLIVEATRLLAHHLSRSGVTDIDPNVLVNQALMDRVLPTG